MNDRAMGLVPPSRDYEGVSGIWRGDFAALGSAEETRLETLKLPATVLEKNEKEKKMGDISASA